MVGRRPATVTQDETRYVWHVTGGVDIAHIVIDRYMLKRETPKFWIVYQRSGLRQFRKNDPWVFINYTAMQNRLAKLKQKKLEEAKRRVEILSNPTSIGVHIIPSGLPEEPMI